MVISKGMKRGSSVYAGIVHSIPIATNAFSKFKESRDYVTYRA